MWYVYFLKLSNDDIYVGSTNDLRRRVKSHQDGRVRSTKLQLPVALKSYVAVETETLARALERYFKSGSGNPSQRSASFQIEPARALPEGAKSPHTSKFVPWKLTTYIAFGDQTKAKSFENYLKSGSGHAFANKRLW